MKGGLISPDGILLGSHRVIYRDKGSQDYQTWDARIWIDSLRDIVASLGGYERISALCVSGQGPTLVPVGEDGLPLYYALLWIDQRGMIKPGSKSFFLPKIEWFRQENPLLYEKTRWFLSCPEYINFFLTGKAATVTPNEEFIPYIWSNDDSASYGLDHHRLPPFIQTGQVIGEVTSLAAAQTGIPPGTPVISGGSDFLMGLLGSATVEPGRTCDRAGTSEGVNFCSPSPVENSRLRILPHIIPGLYNVSGILASTGRLFEWMRQITGQTDRTYRDILQSIENLPLTRSRPLFIPSIEDGGDFQFASGAFLDLHPEHNRDDLGRAVVESIGFGIKRIIQTMAMSECSVQEIRVTGGQARNVIWNQMKADMSGKVILVPEIEDAELLGCAVCALTALGKFSDIKTASLGLTRIRARITPRHENAKIYEELYLDYNERFKT